MAYLGALFTWMFLSDDRDDNASNHSLVADLPPAALLDRFVNAMSPAWGVRFIANLERWTRSSNLTARYRLTGRIHTESEYVPLRRITCALPWMYDLIEYADGFEIPHNLVASVEYWNLAVPVIDATMLTNDLYSAHKEFANGESHNLLFILRHHNAYDWQQAADATVDRINERLLDFKNAASGVRSESVELRRFSKNLAENMAGYLQYFAVSPRYSTSGPIEDD